MVHIFPFIGSIGGPHLPRSVGDSVEAEQRFGGKFQIYPSETPTPSRGFPQTWLVSDSVPFPANPIWNMVVRVAMPAEVCCDFWGWTLLWNLKSLMGNIWWNFRGKTFPPCQESTRNFGSTFGANFGEIFRNFVSNFGLFSETSFSRRAMLNDWFTCKFANRIWTHRFSWTFCVSLCFIGQSQESY